MDPRRLRMQLFGIFAVLAIVSLPASAQSGKMEDTTASHFSAGTVGDGLQVVSQKGDGEIILTPHFLTEFGALPTDWIKVEPPLGAGSVTTANDQVRVENAYTHSLALYLRPRALEFRATFNGPNQRVGFGLLFDAPPWSRFSTDAGGTALFAETNNALETPRSTKVDIPNALGQPHTFRIEWTDLDVRYFVDDVQIGDPHPIAIGADLRPIVRDDVGDSNVLTVDWMRMGPYARDGTFLSRVFNYGQRGKWKTTTWQQNAPAGKPIEVCVRVGKNATPDATWSDWVCPTATSPPQTVDVNKFGQHAQYRATFTNTALTTPELTAVILQVDPACVDVEPGCLAQNEPPCEMWRCNPNLEGDPEEGAFCEQQNTDGTPCNADFCAVEFCDEGVCASTGPENCVDADPCTTDTCDSATGCVNTPKCPSDGNACNGVETCNPTTGACVPGTAPTCNDSNPCTDDDCNPATGCVNTINTNNNCADNDLCDGTETCNAQGQCVDGPDLVCTDNIACTTDSCDPATGCKNEPVANGTACNDQDACTANDACQNGQCQGDFDIHYTEGGQFRDSSGHRWSFGGNQKRKKSGTAKQGHFNANHHSSPKKHINGDVSNIRCGSGCGSGDEGITFDVTDKKTGHVYTVQLKDGGQNNDWIEIDGPDTHTGCREVERGEVKKH